MTDSGLHELDATVEVACDLPEAFDFFSNIHNLDKITPPWLNFEVLSEDVQIEVGTLIDYRLRVRGLPVRWQSEITVWEPPHRFVDEQRRGPYRCWIHEHRFQPHNGRTLITDHVRYAVPGGLLEPLIHRCFVKRDLARIFDYRTRRIGELLGPGAESPAALEAGC